LSAPSIRPKSSQARRPTRYALQSRGNVYAIAHEIAVALFDDVADVNANPEDDVPVLLDPGVALDHRVLHFDCKDLGFEQV
jgi:hypothetical protein